MFPFITIASPSRRSTARTREASPNPYYPVVRSAFPRCFYVSVEALIKADDTPEAASGIDNDVPQNNKEDLSSLLKKRASFGREGADDGQN